MGKKLTEQRKYNHPMEYCEKCKEWIPDLNRHNFKRHYKNKK